MSAFTVETWFNWTGGGTNASTGSGGMQAIPLVTKGRGEADGSNLDMNYFLGIAGGKLAADFEEGPGGPGPLGLNHPITGTNPIATNVWHHAAATYDGQTWRLYLDGVQDATLTLASPAPPRSDSIQHAALATALNSTGVASGFFVGALDETRVWNVARSQAAIQASKNQEIPSATNLIARWGLNEGTGTTAADTSGNNITGTLTGNPTWVTGFPRSDTTAPAPPVGFSANAGDATVTLSWTANSEPDLAGYNLYRSTSTPVPLVNPLNGSTPIAGSGYVDGGVTNGTQYFYVLTAEDVFGNESGASGQVAATPQRITHGLQFDGTSQYVTMGNAPALRLSTFTLETWLKRTGAGVGTSTGADGLSGAIPLVTKGRSEADGSNLDMNYFLGIDSATGVLVADFEEAPGGAGPTGRNHPVAGVTALTSNVWHHAAATYDGQSWRLYLDGQLERTLLVGQPPRSDSIQHFALASALNSSGTPSGFFAGVLDEARIWNVARTQPQIQATMRDDVPSAATLVGRWGMNEGSGTTASDTSGSHVDGTLIGGPPWVDGFVAPPAPPTPTGQVTLNAPANGAPGQSTSPTLDVSVTDSSGGPLTVTFFGRPFASGVFQTIATKTGVASGSSTNTVWSNLGAGQKFEWYATINNGTSSSVGPTWTFRTAPGPDPVFVGAGDAGTCGIGGDEATAAIVDGIDGNVFTTGDNAYPDGTAADYANCYEPSWGVVKSRTRPVAGNHDYGLGNLNGYNGYYGAMATDAGGRSYYSYDIGANWHIVNLDSNCSFVPAGCGVGSLQETWLKADLNANSSKNVIALWHHPRFSSSTSLISTEVQPLWDDLYAAGADVVLDGHAHIYERFAPLNGPGQPDGATGLRQITVGTGGAGHSSVGPQAPNSVVLNNDTYGVLKLSLHANSYDWVFLPEAGRTFADSGSSATHGAPAGPSANPVTTSTNEDTARTVGLSGTDPTGKTLTFSIVTGPAHGQLGAIGTPTCSAGSCTANVTYTPASNYNGADSFTYRVYNGTVFSAPATVSITVTAVNDPPVVDSASIVESSPKTNDTLHTIVTSHDVEGNAVTYLYQWQRNPGNGFTNISGATASTLDLSVAGNGNRADLIRVVVTPRDTANGAPFTSASVTVANTLPAATVALSSHAPSTVSTLTATASGSDADAETVRFTYTWTVNGATVRTTGPTTATTDRLNLALPGNGNGGDTVAVSVVPSDATGSGAAATDKAVVVGGAITFRSSTTASGSAKNITLATPAGIQPGDVLIASVDVESAGITAPSGWTIVGAPDQNGPSFTKGTYWHVVAAGDPTSYKWAFSAKASNSAVMLAYTGAETSNPVDATASASNASSASLGAPSVTTTAANDVILVLYGDRAGSAITQPAGNTERADVSSSSTTSEASDEQFAGPGATGAYTASTSAAAISIGRTIALRAAP